MAVKPELAALLAAKALTEVRAAAVLAKGEKGDQGEQGPQGPAGKDGKDGKNGRDGADGERGIQGERGERGLIGDTGKQGPAGPRGPVGLTGETGEQGLKGDKGDAGVGIEDITQPQPDEMLITLTDEREKRIKLPRSRMAGGVAVGGGGVREIVAGTGVTVDSTDPDRPIVSASAQDVQREVFIGTLPTITYPAIGFEAVSGYSGLYLQSVNA